MRGQTAELLVPPHRASSLTSIYTNVQLTGLKCAGDADSALSAQMKCFAVKCPRHNWF